MKILKTMNNKILKYFLTFVFLVFHGSWMRNAAVINVGWVGEGTVYKSTKQKHKKSNVA